MNAKRIKHRVVRLDGQLAEICVIGLRDPLPTFMLEGTEVELWHVRLRSTGTFGAEHQPSSLDAAERAPLDCCCFVAISLNRRYGLILGL
ncbi:hypothetical protein [Paraburkholderia sacchari]|uniref:hypothetical protein n=1 Tax=Paraburkholderia sacchari TaxID=159450 RepID=UPI001FD143FC|nr:hypothetical protein [Paraburkholderia sacchari]